MLSTLKAEFRKLFTVRSTYVLMALALLIVAFFTLYVEGLRAGDSVKLATKLASEVQNAVPAVSLLGTLVGVLLMTHEYRFNTIMYTLTAARRRFDVLAAKVIAVTTFSVLFTLAVAVIAPALTYLGIQLRGLELVPQQFPVWDLLWQAVFYGWAYSMIGLLFAMLFRSQVGAIVTLFFAPAILELLGGLLLKQNAKYLPFNALAQVLQPMNGAPGALTAVQAMLIVSCYLFVGWVVATVLFLRRDAN